MNGNQSFAIKNHCRDEQKRDAVIFLVHSANQDRDIELLGLVAAWFVTNAPLPVVARFLEWIESDDEVE